MKKLILAGLPLLVRGCLTTSPEDCRDVYAPDSHDYIVCRAEQGSKEHQFRLGMDYFVRGEHAPAIGWFEDSAADDTTVNSIPVDIFGNGFSDGFTHRIRTLNEGGNKAAAYMLAKIYTEGIGTQADPEQVEIYAAKSGDIEVNYQPSLGSFVVMVMNRDAVRLVEGRREDVTAELYRFRAGEPRNQ